jgi:hypothetical protein
LLSCGEGALLSALLRIRLAVTGVNETLYCWFMMIEHIGIIYVHVDAFSVLRSFNWFKSYPEW